MARSALKFGTLLTLNFCAAIAWAGDKKSSCPEADPGFEGGCLVIPENPLHTGSRYIRLFYQWHDKFDSEKETIVFVAGGPGGSFNPYTREAVLRELAQKYNVFFYDQRGVGRSSVITNENISQVDFSFYHTEDNVRDVEMLRDRVIRQPKIIVMGHSYGAHLALAYGVRYPNHVSKLVALNGGADGLGFALQAHRKTAVLDRALKALDGARVTAFFAVAQAGKAVGNDGKPLVFWDFVVRLIGLVSTYEGQTQLAAKQLTELMDLEANRIAIATQLASNGTEGTVPQFRFDAIPEQGLNAIVNPFIACHDLLTREILAKVKDEAVLALAENSKGQICAGLSVPGDDRTFDITLELGKIRAPVLLVGGTHDPLIPIEVQERDERLMREAGVPVRFEKFEDVGHQTLSEHPDRIRTLLWGFLSGTAPAPTAN